MLNGRIILGAMLAVGLSIGSGAVASATTVFSQDFSDPAFMGTQILVGGIGDGTSDRFGPTNYYDINNADGFSFTGGAYLAQSVSLPSEYGLLINENQGTAAATITGLTSGKTYDFSFLLSGDNRPGDAYVLNVAIDGKTTTINGVDGASGTNLGTIENIDFTAGSSTATLYLSQASVTQASPIVADLAVVAVPEPATWALMLLGFGMVGYALRKRSQTTVTYG